MVGPGLLSKCMSPNNNNKAHILITNPLPKSAQLSSHIYVPKQSTKQLRFYVGIPNSNIWCPTNPNMHHIVHVVLKHVPRVSHKPSHLLLNIGLTSVLIYQLTHGRFLGYSHSTSLHYKWELSSIYTIQDSYYEYWMYFLPTYQTPYPISVLTQLAYSKSIKPQSCHFPPNLHAHLADSRMSI